jgi:hypothetical protein
MTAKRAALLLFCFSVAILAFVLLDVWSTRNAPLYKKLERKWTEDVELLEGSHKLPKGWDDIGEIELIGGNPETKAILRKIKVPLSIKKKNGQHKLEVLLVIWEADGKRGALTQYNLVDLKTQNMVAELSRTIMLRDPEEKDPLIQSLDDLKVIFKDVKL